jgi:hypothetical protein
MYGRESGCGGRNGPTRADVAALVLALLTFALIVGVLVENLLESG